MSRREIARDGPLLKNGEIEAAKRALGIGDIKVIEARLASMQNGYADSPQGRLIRSIRQYDSTLKTSKVEKARRRREGRQDNGTKEALQEAKKKLKIALDHADDKARASGYSQTIEMLVESLGKLDKKSKVRERAATQEEKELAMLKDEVRARYYGELQVDEISTAAVGAQRDGKATAPVEAGLLRQ